MILVLGSILVATSMATLMVKQVRQIGVMKTIGGTSAQIGSLYLLMLLAICIIALVVSIPLSRLAAYGFYTQIATLLNLEITDNTIPWTVPAIQILSGIALPFIAAAFPLFAAVEFLYGLRLTTMVFLQSPILYHSYQGCP